MAKMASLAGAVTGKLAGNVYSVNSGQQIVRAYQPNVSNPSTEPQVSNRSKFKLASQLAAAVSPVLAISKVGLVSGRNQFVSNSMGLIRFVLGQAMVNLSSLQLTKSSIELPAISGTRSQDNHITCKLSRSVDSIGVSKVVYAMFLESNANKLQLVKSVVVSEPGQMGLYEVDLGIYQHNTLFIYAYGIIEDENSVLAKYEGYQVDDAEFVATLISSRSYAASGIKTTATQCTIVPVGA